MKKLMSLLLALIVAAGAFSITFVSASADEPIITSPAPAAQRVFTDVEPGTALETSLIKLKNAGIINGYEDGSFQPNGGLSRAEFCKMINILFGYTELDTTGFPDVAADAWYHDHVLIAKKQGYIQGFEDGSFRGNEKITREQVCVILDRINNCYKLYDVAIADEVSDWARDSVVKVISNGLMPLEEGNTFRAKQIITRAEFSYVFVPFLDARAEIEADKEQSAGTNTGTGTGTGTGAGSTVRPGSGTGPTVRPGTGAGTGSGTGSGTTKPPADDNKDDDEGTTTPPAGGGDDGDDEGTTPPAGGGDDGDDEGTTPPAGGGDDGDDEGTTPPAGGGDDDDDDGTTPPAGGGDDGDDDGTTPPAGGDDDEDDEPEVDMTEDDIVIDEIEKLLADLDSRVRFTHPKEFMPFYNKLKDVLRSVIADSETILITPEYVNEEYYDVMQEIKGDYKELCDYCVGEFNAIVNECATKYKTVLVEYFYDIIPEEAFEMLG